MTIAVVDKIDRITKSKPFTVVFSSNVSANGSAQSPQVIYGIGCRVDHVGASVLLQHYRKERVDAMDDTHQINIENPLPGFQWCLSAAPTAIGNTGIVAQHVDRTIVSKRIAGKIFYLVFS